jgi:hypothetical protein
MRLAAVAAGRFRGFADAVQRKHENPSVLEFVTVRRPRG